jgi:N-acetylglucosamine-6-phosphate deacetylase
MLDLAFRVAGDRITLVSDSVAWRNSNLGSTFVDGVPRLPDGTLAGSAITLGRAIDVCVDAGVPWFDALRAASSNVADFLGLDDRGHLAQGRRADIVAFAESREMVGVWTAGRRVR